LEDRKACEVLPLTQDDGQNRKNATIPELAAQVSKQRKLEF